MSVRLTRFLTPCLIGTLALASAGCKQEVQFTRTPVAGVLEPETKASETRVFLSIPANLAPALEAVEAAVAQDIAKWKEYVDDAACDRRKTQWLECNTASTSVALTRDGPAEAAIDGNRLLVTLPVKYEINARGMGWAAYLTDTKVGRVTVGVPFDVVLGSGYRLDVRMGETLVWSEKSADILKKGKVYFAKTGDQRIKSQLKAAAEPLRQAIAGQPIRDTTERAWKSLHTPIELSKGPSLWLRGLPERVTGAGFAFETGQLVYRIALDTKVAIHRGERPAPLFVKPLPEPQRSPSPAAVANLGNKTLLRLPFDVPAPGLEEAVAAAFPKTDLIETRADVKTTPVKVRAVKVQLFPARDRVALELQLDVVEPKRLLGLTGKAYLLGRPVLDPQTGILELRDIAFPAVPRETRDVRTTSLTPTVSGNLIRIGEEPFAGRFAAAARLNVTAPLDSILPRLNTQIRQSLDEQTEISGQFEAATIKSVEPVKGGFRFNLELEGVLAMRSTLVRQPSGVMHQTGSITPLQRTPDRRP